jgi:hypothetical protein
MEKRIAGFFIASAAVILLVTGGAKIISALSGGRVLESFDPIFGVTLRELFWLVGAVEVAVAFVCLANVRANLKSGLLLWITSLFVMYRAGLFWVGDPEFCGCLGTLTGSLRISPAAAASSMKIALAYLFIGSLITSFWAWRQRDSWLSKSGMPSCDEPTVTKASH